MRPATLGYLVGGAWAALLLASSAWFLLLNWVASQQENCESHCITQAELDVWGAVAGSLWLATVVILAVMSLHARRRSD